MSISYPRIVAINNDGISKLRLKCNLTGRLPRSHAFAISRESLFVDFLARRENRQNRFEDFVEAAQILE